MTELPILYSFRRCPYAMRARMALLVSGMTCEIREVVLANKPAAMIMASPKATVPVLVLPGGEVIDQSLDIMHWALGQGDPENWLGCDDRDLITSNDGPFKYHLDRYKYPNRHQGDPIVHRMEGLAFLETLEARLGQNANLCREIRSLADIAIMPFVRQFAATDPAWFRVQPFPRLQNWLKLHTSSSLFEETMMRLQAWKNGDAQIVFPSNDTVDIQSADS